MHYQGQIKRVGPTVFHKKERKYKYLVLGRDRSYFVKNHSDSSKKFSETDIIIMLEYLCSNIPAAPAYGSIYLSFDRYSRACGSYQDFLVRGLLLTKKLLNQGFLVVNLKSSLRKFYGRHHDLVDRYGISVSQMTTDMFHLS
jgi:hypothetical protein